jgi:hypothetical protein
MRIKHPALPPGNTKRCATFWIAALLLNLATRKGFCLQAKYVIIQRGPRPILSLRFQGPSGLKTQATSNSAKGET